MGAHGQAYQAFSARVAVFHDQFVQLLNAGAGSYATAEAANTNPLQSAERELLGASNAPTNAVLGRPLIGDAAAGTAANPNGQAGGLLWGNGGNGYNGLGGQWRRGRIDRQRRRRRHRGCRWCRGFRRYRWVAVWQLRNRRCGGSRRRRWRTRWGRWGRRDGRAMGHRGIRRCRRRWGGRT